MAAPLNPKQWTVLGTATNLTSIYGTDRKFIGDIVIRAKGSNTGIIYFGGSNVTVAPANAGGFIAAGESFSIDLTGRYFSSDDLYFIGTPGDIAFFIQI